MPNIQVDYYGLFEDVYINAPIGIALVSIDGKYIKVNPELCKLLGYTKDELADLSFREITHPDDLDMNNNQITGLINRVSSLYEMEKRYIRKNGNIMWASLHVSLVRDKVGEPLYFISHVIDISEKKAVEQKLRDVEDLYNLITENALDIISYSTPDGITKYISPSVRDLLDYEPDEVIGKNNMHLYHPEDLEEMNNRPYSDMDVFTYRLRHKNGDYVWFETTVKILRDDKGEIQKLFGIGRDITERKRYEDSLADAQRIALLGSWEWDILHDKVSLSDQVYEIHSLDKNKSLKPRDFLYLIHPDDRKQFLENIAQALKGSNLSFEFRQLQPDGSNKYLHIRMSVTLDESGTPLKVYGTTQDITEKKKVELKLQESVERYTSLKKYNHDAVMSFDLSGNIINCNVMAEKLTGYSVKQLIGVSLSNFIGDQNLQTILAGNKEQAIAEKNIDTIKHKDGHYIEVLTTIAPIIINKETVGYYIISKNMTEQKKLLIAKDAAEKTNQAKSEFLAMMSHEIRTPMNGVIGMTDLLLETTDLDVQQKEYVDIIQKSGNTLLTLINDILDFSKIEAGKTELQEEPLSVREITAETLDILSAKALEKNLNMSVSVDPDVPNVLIGDSKRLKQVIINLIGNSIKFTSSGGVTISVKMINKSLNKVQLQFTVQDTGIGIPQETRSHLFEPFYQLDNFMTRKHEGTGLGLAISKKLVELMCGDIWIEQTDNPGATFVFTAWFQEKIQQETINPLAQENKTTQKPLCILIAEDNEINQLVLQKILNKLGYSPSIVKNGNEVIQSIAFETYDIIFMDVQMPVMNGLDATKIIKEMLPSEKAPFIIGVTANALKGDREKCLAAGMDEYISKPIRINDVSTIIEKFHKHKSTP